THTNKGHWNLGHIPVLPVTGKIQSTDIGSHFSHNAEQAKPGYYQVLRKGYDITAELTTSFHARVHRHQFPEGALPKVVFRLPKYNEQVHDWEINQEGATAVSGYQDTGYKVYFYATFNESIASLRSGSHEREMPAVVSLKTDAGSNIEMKIGLSFVSVENAKENLQAELADQSFEEAKQKANQRWNDLLNKIKVTGGSDKK